VAIPFIKETVVYQLSKRFYQLPKSVDSEKKTKGKKSLPTKAQLLIGSLFITSLNLPA